MRELFIFNCEAITVNLRKKEKGAGSASGVLHMYSHVTFSYIKHNSRNLLTIFLSKTHRELHDILTSKVRTKSYSKGMDTKELTVQHFHLLRTHPIHCSLEGQPRELGLKKSTQNLTPTWGKEASLGHDKERAKAELHMQGAMWE